MMDPNGGGGDYEAPDIDPNHDHDHDSDHDQDQDHDHDREPEPMEAPEPKSKSKPKGGNGGSPPSMHNKPGIAIDTDLANQEALGKMEMNPELLNEIQINTNKEPESNPADNDQLLRINKKDPNQELIHVDENLDGDGDSNNDSGNNDQLERKEQT